MKTRTSVVAAVVWAVVVVFVVQLGFRSVRRSHTLVR